jgi:anti-sigma B factor antagonist
MNMTTSTRQVGGVTIVDISGRIQLGQESAALRDLVCDLLSKGHKKILFNLGDVNYIDSSGLGHLVSAFTSVRKQGGGTEATQPLEERPQCDANNKAVYRLRHHGQ